MGLPSRRYEWSFAACLVVASLSSDCSALLDFDHYSFDPPSSGGASGAAGNGEGGAGEGGTAGTTPPTGGSSGNGGNGGGAGGEAGGAGEAGAGGSVPCDDTTGPSSESCEEVPVAVYVIGTSFCDFPIALAVDVTGRIATMLTPLAAGTGCFESDILLTPDRQRVVTFRAGSGQVTFTYDIHPASRELSVNAEQQVSSGFGANEWRAGAIREGPPGQDFDHLFIVNDADGGEGGGIHLYRFDRAQNPGRLDEAGSRWTADYPASVVVHPSGDFIYAILNRETIRAFEFDGMGTLTQLAEQLPLFDAVDRVPRQLLVNPTGNGLYLLSDHRIPYFVIDQSDGSLMRLSESTTRVPFFRRMAMHPNGRFLYAADDTEILAYDIDGDTPLQVDLDDDIQNGFTGVPLTDVEDLEVDASGRFLFVTTGTKTTSFPIGTDGRLGPELEPLIEQPGLRLVVLDAFRQRTP